MPRYYIEKNGVEVAEVVRKFTFFYPKYEIGGLGWAVDGDFFDHDYQITDSGRAVASVSTSSPFALIQETQVPKSLRLR